MASYVYYTLLSEKIQSFQEARLVKYKYYFVSCSLCETAFVNNFVRCE